MNGKCCKVSYSPSLVLLCYWNCDHFFDICVFNLKQRRRCVDVLETYVVSKGKTKFKIGQKLSDKVNNPWKFDYDGSFVSTNHVKFL